MAAALSEDRRRLVEDNARLVDYTLKKYCMVIDPSEYEDMRQEGFAYLCQAARDFNPDYGTKFSTYAISMIHGGVQRYKRGKGAHWRGLHVPRSVLDNFYRACAEANRRGIDVSDDAAFGRLMDVLGIDHAEHIRFVSMQDEAHRSDKGESLEYGDTIPDPCDGFEEGLFRILTDEFLAYATGKVPRRSYALLSFVIREHMDSGKRWTQRELAEMFHLSQAQVSRYRIRWAEVVGKFLEG